MTKVYALLSNEVDAELDEWQTVQFIYSTEEKALEAKKKFDEKYTKENGFHGCEIEIYNLDEDDL